MSLSLFFVCLQMASSNVEYYQKQKDLQEKMHESEKKRLQLEAQLQAYCRSDDKLAKLRAVKLQSYWKKVCEDEKRSKQRNTQLLRDLDRMETNMANLEARREKLRQLKQQYWDYIDRTYPHWLEMVEQKKQEQQQQQQQKTQQQQETLQKQHEEMLQKQKQQQDELLRKQEQERLQLQKQQEMLQKQEQERLQMQKQQEMLQKQEQQRQQEERLRVLQPQSFQQQQQMVRQEDRQTQQRTLGQQVFDQWEEDESPPPLPASPPPPLAFSAGYSDSNREYTNFNEISRQSPVTAPKQPVMSSVTVRMPENPQGEFNTPVFQRKDTEGRKTEQPNANWLQAERDPSIQSASFSEEVSIPIIQPVQSVTVRQKQTEQKMTPPPDPGSEEDVSDFGDDDVPPPLPETEPPGEDTAVKRVLDGYESPEQEPESLSGVHPELNIEGLIHLLKYVEDDIQDALSVEGYYRTRNPDTAQRKEIIHKANTMSTLQGLDAEYVSMVILEQLTPVIRSLPGACLLPDTLLIRNSAVTESHIRSQLHKDVQPLWDKLLEHFVCLVKNRAMGTREVAYVFVPCLAHDSSQYQDKAVSIIERVVEQIVSGGDSRAMSPAQDSINDTARSSLQNGVHYLPRNLAVVPPLKFGSLVDSKPFSDEESSMITQSMPTEGPKVPLNETEAYKTLVSGSMGAKRPPPTADSDDTDDNSDNDLEKQFVSTLSPRSHASLAPSDHAAEKHTEQPKSADILAADESHDLSADQEPLSEVGDLPGISPVYVPTAVEKSTGRTGLGSTGGSSQQRRLAGMISSDIDTDTEVDIERVGMKKSDIEDDDDFHDFYQ